MLLLKNLLFLFIILFIIKNKLNENNFDIEFSKNILNKKISTLIFRILKEKII